MCRMVVVGVALVLSAGRLGAQITTYVAPPRPQPVIQAAAAADSARKDSIAARLAITNMKAWVDSAAGVSVPVNVGDSVPAAEPRPRPPVITTFEDGAVAPTTASSLPAISLFGLLAIAAGSVLLARRSRG